MINSSKYRQLRLGLLGVGVVLFGAQWLFGSFPIWLFAAPMNLLIGALWLVLVWEGFRRRTTLPIVQYLLSAEATYIALAVAAIIALVLGLQSSPQTTSWPVVGGFFYVLTVLSLVILRGWRNEGGVRWRFLITHCGLWLAMTSALLGAPDKAVLRAEVGAEPTREAVNEQGKKSYLDYELRLEKFEVENSENGTPQMFRAVVEVDGEIVDIEVNTPYSQRYGEDIYLVSYEKNSCILQIVREPWRGITMVGIAMLLLGAFLLFLQGFGGAKQ
ncbi:MAG: cytochrome c biogenesis protein ResB [Alistipes sp.]|nr:cytochrome c biogenesis protein ResB [Alistipes sp.]